MAKETEIKKVEDLPYFERQLITVVPDEVREIPPQSETYAEVLEDENEATKKSNYLDYFLKVTDFVGSHNPRAWVVEGIVKTGVEVFKYIKEASKKGIEILPICSTDSARIQFPPGHPRRKTVYVGHPASPNIYFPFTDFHRLMFEAKFSEAITLLMALGASTMNITRLEGWGYEMGSDLALPVNIVKVGEKISAKKQAANDLMFIANLESCHQPQVPDGLLWYEYEPTWKMIANGRMHYGLKGFSLTVTYRDDFGIGLKLKAEIEKAGFEIGANFHEHKVTVWEIKGQFMEKVEIPLSA
jgi:hypothetical protein